MSSDQSLQIMTWISLRRGFIAKAMTFISFESFFLMALVHSVVQICPHEEMSINTPDHHGRKNIDEGHTHPA